MAKGAYLGIGDTARKVKNIYVGAGVNTYQKTVTATEFQQGALLYSSGNLDTSFTDYVSTTNFYEASYGNVVKIISSKVTPLEDSGFLWYDSNHNFISGNKGTVSGKFVNGEPPVNTAYFKFNLNSSGVTPSTASGTGIAVYSVARKIKKAYIGDENGLARLCWSESIPYLAGNITLSSNSSSITINNIDFVPKYVMCLSFKIDNSSTYTMTGMISEIPTPSGTYSGAISKMNPTWGNIGKAEYSSTSKALTLTPTNGSTTYKFWAGTYYYLIASDLPNVIFGTQTLNMDKTPITINIGDATEIDKMMIYAAPYNDYNVTYGVKDTTLYAAEWDDASYEYNTTRKTKTITYSISNGVLTLNGYSSNYPFGRYLYYLIVTK